MRGTRALLRFAYDFVVGDDPLMALLVVAGLGTTAVVAGAGAAAWWVLPIAVVGALAVSLVRAAGD